MMDTLKQARVKVDQRVNASVSPKARTKLRCKSVKIPSSRHTHLTMRKICSEKGVVKNISFLENRPRFLRNDINHTSSTFTLDKAYNVHDDGEPFVFTNILLRPKKNLELCLIGKCARNATPIPSPLASLVW